MAKPLIVINGGTPGVKASVAASSVVNFTLDSIIGVRSVQWEIISTDETSAIGDYTLAQSGSVGQNMSTTALVAGTAAIVKVTINNGIVRSLPDPESTTNTSKFYVATAEGLEVGAAGEMFESDATFGTTEILNRPIRVLNAFTTSLYETDLKRAKASAIANVALTGDPSPMDGQTIATGDFVFLSAQTAPAENGLWEVDTGGAWSRPAHFATDAAIRGSVIAVVHGTARAGYFYRNTNATAITVGTTALTFERLPDQFDRADLAQSSSTPAPAILTRFGPTNELYASSFRSSSTNPAGSGLLRSIKNAVAVAFRDDANGADLEAVSMDATDTLRYGSSLVDNLLLSVQSGGEIRLLDNAIAFLRAKLTGIIFGRTATMSLTQEASTTGTGSDATIQAQEGFTGGDGGTLYLKSGVPGTGGAAGNVVIDVGDDGAGTSGVLSFESNTSPFATISNNSGVNTMSFIVSSNIFALAATQQIKLNSDVAFFANGSFGSGSKVIFIANATTVPTTNPTGGGILYCEGGALKFRGSGGTVTTIAPT